MPARQFIRATCCYGYHAAGADAMGGRRIAGRKDDPAQVAVRNADWATFMGKLNNRQRCIVRASVEGESCSGQAAHLGICPSAITQRRHTIAKRARQFWGDEVLTDAGMQPLWRRQAQQR